jgi:tripartite ATP-independent transporter DctP family solute receptor
MSVRMSLRPWLALLVLASPPLTGCGRAPEARVWRFAIEETQGSVQHAYAKEFERRIEERSGGGVDVKVYDYGTLGTSDQTSELLHNGSIQLAMASPGHLGKMIPEVQALLLHFLLSDDERVNNVALRDEALLSLLDGLYAEKGYQLLAVFSEGWMVWTLNREVRAPEDFAGLKMRVMTTPLLLAAYEAYGASPTPLPYSEVYSALQLSMVDGQVNPVFAIQEMSFHEVTDFMIFANQAPFVTTAAANRRFYEGLSEADRAMLDQVIEELQDYVFDLQRKFNAERMDLIRKRRPDLAVLTLTEAERARFREASLPVRDRYLALAPRGQSVLDAVEAAIASAERQIAQEQGDLGDGEQEH